MTPERLREIAPNLRLTDKELWENSCITRYQLENWTDDDIAKHSAGMRHTVRFLLERLDAIAPLIEAARAEGQKDMQERCTALADADISKLNEKSIAHKAAGDLETMYRINAAWHSVRSLYTAIAALPIDGANDDPDTPTPEMEKIIEDTNRQIAVAFHGEPIKVKLRGRPSEAKQGAEPVAWIAFAGNGNIRFWTADPERAAKEKESGLDLRMFTLAELIALVSRIQQLTARVEAAEASLAEAERVMEIIAGRRQCIDNLMSNADVARAWLDSQSHLKDKK